MKLSIITINYNNNNGLKQTIKSVISQSFRDFEYIIVDGASADDSVATIKELVGNNTSIPCLWTSEPDKGIYNAMNKGIMRSHGEYLLFLNSGDFLVGESVLDNVFSQDCSADILCARSYVSDNGKRVWTSPLPPNHITLGWLHWHGMMHQSTFIRRSLFDSIGLYDESFKWLADFQFWYKAFIYNDASSQSIDVITTDYNLDGTSSLSRTNKDYIYEESWPERQPVLRNVLPDYKEWDNDKAIVKRYGWIDSHKWLRSFLSYFRKGLNLISKYK